MPSLLKPLLLLTLLLLLRMPSPLKPLRLRMPSLLKPLLLLTQNPLKLLRLPSNSLGLMQKADFMSAFFSPSSSQRSTQLPPIETRFLTGNSNPFSAAIEYRRQRRDGQFGTVIFLAQMRRHNMLQSACIDLRQ